MKNICANCHFLAKEYREQNTGRALSFSVSSDERNKAKHGENEFIGDMYSLKCQMGVWDEGVSPGKEDNPSMLLDAAIELQKRQQENYQIKRSNMYTRIGLWIASGALVINAIIGIIRLSKCT
jgi:hypothetical protein